MCEEDEKKSKPEDAPVAAQIQKEFLKQRKIFLWGAVEDSTARDVTEKLLYLEAAAPGEPITFYVNTPGGSITAGMAIFDTIRLISSPVKVIVTEFTLLARSVLSDCLTNRRPLPAKFIKIIDYPGIFKGIRL